MFMYYYCYICSVLDIVFYCVVLCTVCVNVYCTTVPVANPIAVSKYIMSYHII